jgi:hypothetical protein
MPEQQNGSSATGWRNRPAWSHGMGGAVWLWTALSCCLLLDVLLSLVTPMHAGAFALNFLKMGSLDAVDSWKPMIVAIDHLRATPEVPVYQAIFFGDKIKFQYPVSSLVAIDLLQKVSGLRWETVISLLNRVCWYSVWLTGLVSWRLLANSYAAIRRSPASSSDELTLLWPCLGLTVLFYPLSKSYNLGQIQTIMTLLGALALLFWQIDRKLLAGLCIGLCCAIKPQWTVVLVWAGLRREWIFTVTASLVLGPALILSAARYGIHHYVDYLSVLSFLSRHGEAYFPNQSVNGLLNRLLFNGIDLSFDMHGFPPFNIWVYIGTLISTAVILLAALFYRRRAKPNVLDLALILLAATAASPIAWEHHYAILLPIFAALAPLCFSRETISAFPAAVLFGAFVIAAQRLEPLNSLADSLLNVLQSYLFIAALVVLGLLFQFARSAGDHSRPAT